MAAAGPAAGPSTSKNDIDIYSDLNQNDEDLEANELFDAVLTGSVNQDKNISTTVAPSTKTSAQEDNKSTGVTTQKGGNSLRKLSLYIGNFPWWTSDKDIVSMAQRLGVKDITEIKFAENKVNGQSRGFAEVVVTSEESLKTLLEKIPRCEINGERVDCRFATRQNLSVFEEIANKRIPLRVNSKESKEPEPTDKIPSLLSQKPSPPPIPPLLPSHPLVNRFPSLPAPCLGQPPPLFPHLPPTIPPPMPPSLFPCHPVHVPSQPSPSLHINPAFFNTAQDGHSSKAYNQQKHTPRSAEGDFEELMNRNKAITSSAITKAVSGATAGDMRVAMETLLTAIAIIKQSRVYGDERCQALVTSLKDCLVSIQGRAVVPEKKKETGTGVVTENEKELARETVTENVRERETATESVRENVKENVIEKILMAGMVWECLEDTESIPGMKRETRNAQENEKGTEIIETGTANLDWWSYYV
uniref:Cleavage and polyadenylation specific factor 7 n=1 Tax=Amphiprion ocellaris TaxID=80972 RepID=A0A3Q1D1Z6_AMPOC